MSTSSKKKVAIVVGYIGSNYHGLQISRGGPKTIEEELEDALYKCGAIIESNYTHLDKIGWLRAARTDKGVHAVANVCCAKLLISKVVTRPMEDLRDRVNKELPDDITVHSIVQVVGGFNPKNTVDSRHYVYTMPTFVFAPHQREVPVLESSAPKTIVVEDSSVKQDAPTDPLNSKLSAAAEGDPAWRLPEGYLEKINSIMKEKFVGTHNYHNFTAKRAADDPSCKRFITEFQCSEPFMIDGVEWIRVNIKGSSFMLHQIRKMVGTVVEYIRGACAPDFFRWVFTKHRILLPLAPAQGLFLRQLSYDTYNRKYWKTRQCLDFADKPDIVAKIESFEKDRICPHIAQREAETGKFLRWVQLLNSGIQSYQAYPLNLRDLEERRKKRIAEKRGLKKERERKRRRLIPPTDNGYIDEPEEPVPAPGEEEK